MSTGPSTSTWSPPHRHPIQVDAALVLLAQEQEDSDDALTAAIGAGPAAFPAPAGQSSDVAASIPRIAYARSLADIEGGGGSAPASDGSASVAVADDVAPFALPGAPPTELSAAITAWEHATHAHAVRTVVLGLLLLRRELAGGILRSAATTWRSALADAATASLLRELDDDAAADKLKAKSAADRLKAEREDAEKLRATHAAVVAGDKLKAKSDADSKARAESDAARSRANAAAAAAATASAATARHAQLQAASDASSRKLSVVSTVASVVSAVSDTGNAGGTSGSGGGMSTAATSEAGPDAVALEGAHGDADKSHAGATQPQQQQSQQQRGSQPAASSDPAAAVSTPKQPQPTGAASAPKQPQPTASPAAPRTAAPSGQTADATAAAAAPASAAAVPSGTAARTSATTTAGKPGMPVAHAAAAAAGDAATLRAYWLGGGEMQLQLQRGDGSSVATLDIKPPPSRWADDSDRRPDLSIALTATSTSAPVYLSEADAAAGAALLAAAGAADAASRLRVDAPEPAVNGAGRRRAPLVVKRASAQGKAMAAATWVTVAPAPPPAPSAQRAAPSQPPPQHKHAAKVAAPLQPMPPIRGHAPAGAAATDASSTTTAPAPQQQQPQPRVNSPAVASGGSSAGSDKAATANAVAAVASQSLPSLSSPLLLPQLQPDLPALPQDSGPLDAATAGGVFLPALSLSLETQVQLPFDQVQLRLDHWRTASRGTADDDGLLSSPPPSLALDRAVSHDGGRLHDGGVGVAAEDDDDDGSGVAGRGLLGRIPLSMLDVLPPIEGLGISPVSPVADTALQRFGGQRPPQLPPPLPPQHQQQQQQLASGVQASPARGPAGGGGIATASYFNSAAALAFSAAATDTDNGASPLYVGAGGFSGDSDSLFNQAGVFNPAAAPFRPVADPLQAPSSLAARGHQLPPGAPPLPPAPLQAPVPHPTFNMQATFNLQPYMAPPTAIAAGGGGLGLTATPGAAFAPFAALQGQQQQHMHLGGQRGAAVPGRTAFGVHHMDAQPPLPPPPFQPLGAASNGHQLNLQSHLQPMGGDPLPWGHQQHQHRQPPPHHVQHHMQMQMQQQQHMQQQQQQQQQHMQQQQQQYLDASGWMRSDPNGGGSSSWGNATGMGAGAGGGLLLPLYVPPGRAAGEGAPPGWADAPVGYSPLGRISPAGMSPVLGTGGHLPVGGAAGGYAAQKGQATPQTQTGQYAWSA